MIDSILKGASELVGSLYTTDGQMLDKQAALEKLRQSPYLAQIEVNKIEASHRSIAVSGWRPFIGWVCGVALAYNYLIWPVASVIVRSYYNFGLPQASTAELMPLLMGMLGFGALRTYEKVKGRTL